MMKRAVIVSTMDLGTPVVCCMPMAPDFRIARNSAMKGTSRRSFLTISAASMPLEPRFVAKLLRK
jgi:hypothetical protein